MDFLWPDMLWLSALLPALVAAYVYLLRGRKHATIAYPTLQLVRAAQATSWSRHLPGLLLLGAAACLVIAAARPTALVTLPSEVQTIILVMDVSASMSARDVVPTRLRAAQAAAKTFVQGLPAGIRVGLVVYGSNAHLVQPPTLLKDEVLAAIDRFELENATAIGRGLVVALQTLFPEEHSQLSKLEAQGPLQDQETASAEHKAASPASTVRAGSFESAAIVLLTDGQNTTGPDPMEAAQIAADHGVKVFTVGFGRPEGIVLEFAGVFVRVRLDEALLKQIANLTNGAYFRAGDEADLNQVYQALHGRLVLQRRSTEITALFALAAGVLMLVGSGVSVWRYGRIA